MSSFQKYGTDPNMDQLVQSTRPYHNVMAARSGYGLDVLVNSPHALVLYYVADHGYGLDRLIHDEKNPAVRFAAKQYLDEHGYKSIYEWVSKNLDKLADKTSEMLAGKGFLSKTEVAKEAKEAARGGSSRAGGRDMVVTR